MIYIFVLNTSCNDFPPLSLLYKRWVILERALGNFLRCLSCINGWFYWSMIRCFRQEIKVFILYKTVSLFQLFKILQLLNNNVLNVSQLWIYVRSCSNEWSDQGICPKESTQKAKFMERPQSEMATLEEIRCRLALCRETVENTRHEARTPTPSLLKTKM